MRHSHWKKASGCYVYANMSVMDVVTASSFLCKYDL